MKIEVLGSNVTDVAGAREEVLNIIERNIKDNTLIIYFYGWAGFGATAVLRSIAQVLPSMKAPSPKLRFGKTIYVDCSFWKNKRMMQRKIAEELKLGQKTMAMFDKQDEEDDFSGVDLGSRDVIPGVAALIDRTLRETRFMIIFINGSDEEIDLLRRIGIPEYSDSVIVWTFSTKRFVMKRYSSRVEIVDKLKYADVFIECIYSAIILSSAQFNALFSEEAANIVPRLPSMSGMDHRTVVACCLYGLFLYYSFQRTTGFVWPAHAPNYWICDEVIQGEKAGEISNALHPEITFECDVSVLDAVFKKLKDEPKTPFLVVKDGGDDDIYEVRRPIYYRWISISVKNKKLHEGMQNILERASSIFLALETKDRPYRLPNGIFKLCNNLGVLVLSCCGFSFVSPPFLHCHTLRFLGLDHCADNNNSGAVEHQGGACATRWAFLQSLCVLDLYYTDWVELLSEEKMELMANITELNIEGIRCSHLLRSWLQKRLPHLQRLRIIKPIYDNNEAAETMSSDINDSFLMDNTASLEILDLSGNNRGMRKLPASMSEAGHLQVLILDGCDGLEEVVLSGNKSIRSFSFDGYGPAASHRTSTVELPPVISRPPKHPLGAEKQSVVKTSKVSLEGCTRLDNLFLRGLPNLEELDLSGCPIKVLDFESVVVDVPRLKRLFLLGCENLHAIKWGSGDLLLELICIDTRPRVGCARPLSLCAQQKSFKLQVHAIIVDARLARSLCAPINSTSSDACYFNISIASSATCMETIQPEATTNKEKLTGSNDHQRHYDTAARDMYGDVFTKVGGDPTPMQAFPLGPTGQLDCHIEIGDGCCSVQSEVETDPYGVNLARLMRWHTQSLHVHDVSTYSNTMPTGHWNFLRWCRVERCPNLHAVFPPGAEDSDGKLETIWASDLRMARFVWSKGVGYYTADRFRGLRHLHLRCCPSLQFGLAMGKRPSFPSLETLHVIHCGSLRHIFVPGDEEYKHTSVKFPKLTTIHLHDLPALRQICEGAVMLAPALETIRIRGCWSLRQLPALKGREPGMRRPTVEKMEKDVWDALKWDGMDAGHHPSLYEAPVHSRYYKRRTLRTTVLR